MSQPQQGTVVSNLRVIKAARDWSNDQLGQAMGISGAAVKRRLSGQADVTVPELLSLSNAIDVDMNALFAPHPLQPQT